MTLSKQDIGFVILDEEKLPEELVSEIKHFNGLIKTSNQSPHQKAAISNSENKILRILEKQKGLYPIHVIYGYIPLIQLIMRNKSNPSEIIEILEKVKQDFGEDYFKKLLLYDPLVNLRKPLTGSNSFDISGAQMNIFMLAVKKGDVQLVKSILDYIDDTAFKKEILQQCLQYWDNENQLVLKPILDLAIESDSADVVNFLMSTMNQLGILAEVANNYTGLLSTKENNTNLLKKAIATKNDEIIDVILNYRKHLGRAFYIVPDQSYPNYIITKMNLAPVFLTPILNNSPDIFEKILDETIRDFELNKADNYWSINYKISTLISSLSMVDLIRYIQHKDFNPVIFSKILSVKLDLDKMIDYLEIRKTHYEIEMGIPILRTPEGVDLNTSLSRNLLWVGDAKNDFLSIPNILLQLFTTAMSAHNFQAAALTLCEYFNTGHTKELDEIISKQDKIIKNVLCNFLLLQAVKSHNSSLIEFMAKQKFVLKKEIYKEISELKDPQSLVFVAKELFHNLHENKFTYDPQDLKIILDKILVITKTNKDDKNLSETISLFLNETRQTQNKRKKRPLFGKSKQEQKIEKLLDEIEKQNTLKESPHSLETQDQQEPKTLEGSPQVKGRQVLDSLGKEAIHLERDLSKSRTQSASDRKKPSSKLK